MSIVIKHKKYKLEIKQDLEPEDPRNFDGNITRIICFHNRYDFPNDLEINQEDFNSWEEIAKYLIKEFKPILIKPLYLYDHSGLWIKMGEDFYNEPLPQGHARFDSGQIGFILITKEDIKKHGLKPTKKLARSIIEEEFKTYSNYISGNVYQYFLTKEKNCKTCKHIENEHIDSCSGFYDIKNIFDHLGLKPELVKIFKAKFEKNEYEEVY